MKKILAIILCMTMLLTFSASAFAEAETQVVTIGEMSFKVPAGSIVTENADDAGTGFMVQLNESKTWQLIASVTDVSTADVAELEKMGVNPELSGDALLDAFIENARTQDHPVNADYTYLEIDGCRAARLTLTDSMYKMVLYPIVKDTTLYSLSCIAITFVTLDGVTADDMLEAFETQIVPTISIAK